MKIGYKSEAEAVWLAVATGVVLLFLSMKTIPFLLPIWAVASRFVARGSRNRCRPVNVSDFAGAQQRAHFVMSADMHTEERPVALVTGTNSGIGYYTAVGLAAEGYVVVVTCRSAILTEKTATRIQAEALRRRLQHPERYHNTPESVIVVGNLPLECDDFGSVRTFARWFIASFQDRNVQVLVNNAGGMRKELCFSKFCPQLEFHTAVNFLGPLLLTELLLPLLEKNGGRVVYVSSEAHRFPPMVLESGYLSAYWGNASECGVLGGKLLRALEELNQGADKACGPFIKNTLRASFVRYGASKLFNTYHAHVIARRYRHVSNPKDRVFACSLHPGCVQTNFSRDIIGSGILSVFIKYAALLFLKNSEEGAQTTLHCAMCTPEELELVTPPGSDTTAAVVSGKMHHTTKERSDGCARASDDGAVSPYFVECTNKTRQMLLAYGWDLTEAESIVAWGKRLVGLPN